MLKMKNLNLEYTMLAFSPFTATYIVRDFLALSLLDKLTNLTSFLLLSVL